MGKLLELKSEKIGNKNKEEERIKKVPKTIKHVSIISIILCLNLFRITT